MTYAQADLCSRVLVSAYLTTIRVIHIQGDMLVCTTMSVTVTITAAMAVPVTRHAGLLVGNADAS